MMNFNLLINSKNQYSLGNINSNFYNYEVNQRDYEVINQWIKNPHFNPPINESWVNSKSGDPSDLELTEGDGEINYNVIGDNGTVNYTWDPPTQNDWVMMRNPELTLFPNDTNAASYIGFDSAGIIANHTWDEGLPEVDAVGQNPSVIFKRNEFSPVNLSDYIVTSVSINALVNFSANSSVEKIGDTGMTAAFTYDHVRTYVRISDLNKSKSYEIAYYKYKNDSSLSDTYMNTVPENELVYIMNNIFQNNINFTLTLGIDFFCEDNNNTDIDIWHYVRIKFLNFSFTYEKKIRTKSVNLSFSYQKKINQFTIGQWKQTGDLLNGQAFTIDEAKLFFQYKIDSNWTLQ